MRKLCLFAVLATFAFATATTCLAADNPWNGTWKLNEAKSHLTGSTITFTQSGDMYTVNTGAISYKFACDGKDYPIIADRTISCTQSGNVYTTNVKVAGKFYESTKHELSADGKMITEVETGTRPDGTKFTDNSTAMRVGEGKGLAGTWKETKVKSSAPDVIVLKVNGPVLHWEEPGYKEFSDANLDGTPAPLQGGMAPPGMMISNKLDAGKVTTVVTLSGKDLEKDIMSISADGKSVTDVVWTPGKESEKRTYVYDKQ